MKTTQIVSIDGQQAVTLPDDFRFDAETVAIRKEGDRVILEPVKPNEWPEGFFDSIHVSDPGFSRPSQGDLPPIPSLDSE